MSSVKVNKQKLVADKVLNAVESFDPTCIVAGGAPRDWYFGKEATDIDLFFHFRPDSTLGQVKGLLEKSLGQEVVVCGREDLPDSYKKNPNLKRVFEITLCDEKVQFMEMDEPTWNTADNFPLTICKIWYKGGKTYRHGEFIRAEGLGVIIKTGTLYSNRDKYVRKIVEKFPDMPYYESFEDLFKRGGYEYGR